MEIKNGARKRILAIKSTHFALINQVGADDGREK